MKTTVLAVSLAALLAGGGAFAGSSAAPAVDSAQYEIRFDATWTAASHPLDYPSNAHFSGLAGATHHDGYRIFADGMMPTPGLEALSERGAHSPLTDEIGNAIQAGSAGALFESGALFSFPGSIKATFTADAAHPFASAAAMVAPSPDWFTGVSNVALMQNGKWIEKATFTLFVWDAGTDGGTAHQAADEDSMPRQSVRLNAAPQFKDENGLKPVGTVTFTRINKTASN